MIDIDPPPSTIKELAFERMTLTTHDMPIIMYEKGIKTQSYHYQQFGLRIFEIAASLRNESVEHSSRVVVISANCLDCVACHIAIMAIGAITVPISNTESPTRYRMIKDIVNPCLIIIGKGVSRNLIDEMRGEKGTKILQIDQLKTARQVNPIDAIFPEVTQTDVAAILFTSGTTAGAKGATLTHRNLLSNAEGLRRAHSIRSKDIMLCVLPLFHANAFGFSMLTTLYCHAGLILCDNFPGFDIWRVARLERVKLISLVPQLIDFLSKRSIPSPAPDHLEYVVSAAAPLQKQTAKRFIEATGISIRQGYGLSECVNFAAVMPGDLQESFVQKLLFDYNVPSIGSSLHGNELHVCNPDGSYASEGEVGELVVSGDTIMAGYWNDPTETADALRSRCLWTGDQGFYKEINGTEYFFITGRRKETIIRNGQSISPQTVDAELAACGMRGDYCAVGFVNANVGDEIGLYISKNLGMQNEDELKSILMRCTTDYRPRCIFVGEEPIPRTAVGKLQRLKLNKYFEPYREISFHDRVEIFYDKARLETADSLTANADR